MQLKWIAVAVSLTLGGAALAEDAPADIWKSKCGKCHGEDGKAQTPMGQKQNIPDFTSPAWQKHNTDDEIRKVITDGSTENPKMRPFKDRLSAAEIDSMVKYIRDLGKAQKK